jgi:hypothetical protein
MIVSVCPARHWRRRPGRDRARGAVERRQPSSVPAGSARARNRPHGCCGVRGAHSRQPRRPSGHRRTRRRGSGCVRRRPAGVSPSPRSTSRVSPVSAAACHRAPPRIRAAAVGREHGSVRAAGAVSDASPSCVRRAISRPPAASDGHWLRRRPTRALTAGSRSGTARTRTSPHEFRRSWLLTQSTMGVRQRMLIAWTGRRLLTRPGSPRSGGKPGTPG